MEQEYKMMRSWGFYPEHIKCRRRDLDKISKDTWETVDNFLEAFEFGKSKGFYLLSKYHDNGKTSLATWIVKAIMFGKKARDPRGITSCRFWNFQEKVIDSWSLDAQGKQILKSEGLDASILVLDDLGKGRISEFAANLLNIILQYRRFHNKLTIMTSNFSPSSFHYAQEAIDSKLKGSISNHIKKMTETINFDKE